MLLGEHAVLHGRRALVCAIDKRITVTLSPVNEKMLRINSALGNYETPLDSLTDHPDFRFVLDAVKQYSPAHGIELNIESEFSSDIGFGSSAAVTVATHAALIGSGENKNEIFKRSLATIHRVQGRGSGADVAASVFGGVVAYRSAPLEIHLLSKAFPLTAVYSGAKMKTPAVIKIVETARAAAPGKYETIFDEIDSCTGDTLNDISNLGSALIKNQKLMEEMKLNNAALDEIISAFRAAGVPSKISGSGLGDCAIGLGEFPSPEKYKTYPLKISLCGVNIE